MADLICRKTMMRCQTQGMCSPHGGCQHSHSAAPHQPAGVDGLKRYEVFPYLDDDVAELDICESDDGTFVKYDDATAIIDGLRGEVERAKQFAAGHVLTNERISANLHAVESERDQQAQRIGELEGLLRHAQKQVPTGSGLHMRIDAALSAVCAAAPNIATTSEHSSQPERDPCPMCIKGGICNTPTCGRLLAMPKAY